MEHKTISLADQVFERLEHEILSGIYQRGEILTEMRLCTDLGVSRTPVREALRRLEQEHIIEMSGKGIVVLGVTEQDLHDIYDIRREIEGDAAFKTAERITEEEIEEMRSVLELQEFYVSKKDAEHIRALDSQFHQLVYRFTGSAVYYDTLMPLHKKVQKHRKKSVENNSRAQSSLEEHRKIYDAIANHDAPNARRAMIAHVENARNHIIK